MAQRRNQRGAAADAVAPEEVFHDAAPPPAPAPAAAAPAEPQAAAQQELIGRDAMGRVDRFSGSSGEDFLSWIQHVETVADANNWSAETMRRSIVVNLTGAAASVVAGLDNDQRRDLRAVIDALTASFGVVSTHELFAQLRDMRKDEDESVGDYANRFMATLQRLRVTGERPSAATQVDQFCRGLPGTSREHVLRAAPASLPEAVALAKREEAIRIDSDGRSSRPGGRRATTTVAAITQSGDARRADLAEAPTNDHASSTAQASINVATLRVLEQMMGRLEALKAPPPRAWGDFPPRRNDGVAAPDARPRRTPDGLPICFQCGEAGHIRAVCRNRPQALVGPSAGVSLPADARRGPPPRAVNAVVVAPATSEADF